jgi:thiol-disulfide isomerase/thioredoxin
MNEIILIILLNLFLAACGSQTQNRETYQPKSKIFPKPVSGKPIQLYAIDTSFQLYMPDTSLIFANSEDLTKYYFHSYRKFKDFCKKLKETPGENDSVVLSVRQAEIRFEDLAEVINMKFYKTRKRDVNSMNMLGAFSPTSNIISLQERIAFFKTFPVYIQNQEVGRKTWKRFMEYLFDKNIGLNVHIFDKLEITDTQTNKIILKNVFNSRYKYYIFVFGASWCLPCRMEELQLKYWLGNIDTSLVKIVALSIDRDINKWKQYLNEDKFSWECYLLQGEMNNTMVKRLKFEGIPRNFLIDMNGNILAENTDIRKILKKTPIVNTE